MSPGGIHIIIIMSKIVHQKASDNDMADSEKEDENLSTYGSLQETDGEEESQPSAGHLILLPSASPSAAIPIVKRELPQKPRPQTFLRTDGISSFSGSNMNITDPQLKRILDNNSKWVDETNERDPEFFANLIKPQKPKYLYFGCSDSRVPANQILGLGPGEVFVHRNIGNLVPGNDLNALSVLEYAVNHLGVTDIIVTGHYDCGAIRAATSRQDLGLLENWLRQIRDVHRLHKDYLDLISDEEQCHCSLVELNVIEQCLNLYKTGVVQRKRHQTRKELLLQNAHLKEEEVYPRIYGMVFNPADGHLKKLTVNFERRVGSLDHIYGLYDDNNNKDK